MSHKYPLIAAAVAVAVASGYADAAVPTLSAAASPTVSLVIAGSSAAQSGVATAIETDICGGVANTLVSTSKGGTGNFAAYSCNTAIAIPGSPGIPAGTLITVYYRSEGGSVVGALPIVSGHTIKRLNLADSTDCAQSGGTASCTVTGTTATSGTQDSWSGAVVADTVQLGVTDVEPAQLTNADYPSNYLASAFGSATPAQLKGLTTSKLFQQVFGLAINTQGTGIAASETQVTGNLTYVNLSKEAASNIIAGNYTDWSSVPDLSGAQLTSTSSPITRIDREPGSGTRTATNIYLLSYQCGSATAINSTGETLNFSTGDELTLANNTPGAIAYTSIDQLINPTNQAKYPNLHLAAINGVVPSTQAAAAGAYDFWFEATLVPNPSVGTNSQTGNLISYLQTNLPLLAKAPSVPDVNVIPNVGTNVGSVPLTSNGKTGTAAVYVNPYTRSGNSCNVPSETN